MPILKRLNEFVIGIKREILKSLFFTFILLAAVCKLQLYSYFQYYEEGIKELLLCFIGGYVGLLGFSLSGIAILVGLFNKTHIEIINKDGAKNIDKLMNNYQFLSSLSALLLLIVSSTYITIFSPLNLIGKSSFYVLVFIIIFTMTFSIIYTVELVRLTIRLYKIKNKYDKAEELTGKFRADINEIRIDVMLRFIMTRYNISIEEIAEEIESAIEDSEYPNKELMINYIKDKYGLN